MPLAVTAQSNQLILTVWNVCCSWLRHSALVEAQLRLMQRLSSQLQAHSGRQVCGSNAPDAEEWQEILQLWQEV